MLKKAMDHACCASSEANVQLQHSRTGQTNPITLPKGGAFRVVWNLCERMKQPLSLLLALALLFSFCDFTVAMAEQRSDSVVDSSTQTATPTPIATGEELSVWLRSHLRKPGVAQLTKNVTLPRDFEFAYWGETGTLTIQTGPFTLSTIGNAALIDVAVRGEGVDGPVLSGTSLALSENASITATGRDGVGGTAVYMTDNLNISDARIAAYGEHAVGAVCSKILGSKGRIAVQGDQSIALRLNTTQYSPGSLQFFTIQADGENAVSIEADGMARKLVFTECKITPAVDFGESIHLEPQDNWNQLVLLASPSEHYQPPASVGVRFQKESCFATASLQWPEDLPDFSAPGTYELTATVTDCELKSLIGADYHLTVQIGENLPPVLNKPASWYNGGQLRQLQFPASATHVGAGKNTGLWYSADGGDTWQVGVDHGWKRFDLDVGGFADERPYLLVLKSEQDGVMNGLSQVWELTIHEDERFTLVPTDLPPPVLTSPVATAASWEELFAIVADENRKQTTYTVTTDLLVDGYVDLQRKKMPLNLDMGAHGITVQDGGWLILGVDELRGLGTDKPVITVEPGGTLVLGRNMFYSYVIGRMHVVASGTSHAGGVAVEVQEGGTVAAVNHPRISAQGSGAVGVRSLTQHPFSLPSGLSLKVEGPGAAALETYGDVDLFYSNVYASGDGAQAVRAPSGTSIVIDSANVSPQPDDAVLQTSTFLDFNQDVKQPLNLWLGREQGMYLSDVPVLATVARGGDPADTAPIWVDGVWDTSGVAFMMPGNYHATGRFSPLLPVNIAGLPVDITVDVSIKDPKGKPDISIIYPIPPVSMGDGAANYGFYIVPNADYTDDISTLWCSVDDGDTWVEAETLFDVFWPSFWAGSDNLLYVMGLEPDKAYLFKLESTGRSGMGTGSYAEAGVSEVRQVTISSSGKVVNLDWSGDRDGGDTEGNKPDHPPAPPESGDPDDDDAGNNKPNPPLTPPDNGNSGNSPSDGNGESTPHPTPYPSSDPTSGEPSIHSGQASAPEPSQDRPAMAPTTSQQPKTPPFQEKSGETYSRLSGAQLREMAVGGEVQFSKQGIAITLSKETLERLSIQDESVFFIEIKRQNDNAFSFAVAVDDNAVLELVGTRVSLPYTVAGEASVVVLKNEEQKIVSTGSYNQEQRLAAFVVDNTGRFTVAEGRVSPEALPSEPPVTTDLPPQDQISIMPFLFWVVCLLVLGGAFLWKRRGKS